MPIVAGLQDFRGQGTPKDMGAFIQPCTVNIFLDGGIYYAVNWSGGVLVGSNAVLSTVITNTLTYLAGVGGGTVFLSLMGTHTITVTVAVNVANVQFMGLGKVTVLQVNNAAPAPLFNVTVAGVSFYNITFDGFYVGNVAEVDGIDWAAGSDTGLVSGCYFVNWGVGTNNHPVEVIFGSTATNIIVANCHFRDCADYTVAFASAAGHCVAIGNIVINSLGFETDNGIGNVFSGNVFQGTGTLTICAAAGDRNLVVGNTYSGGGTVSLNGDNIVFTGNLLIDGAVYSVGGNNTVSGCTFYGGSYQIDQQGNDGVIVGNTFDQFTSGGVSANGGDDVVISGNSFIGVTDGVWPSCVRFASGTYRTLIIGNRMNAFYGVRIEQDAASAIIKDNNFNGCTWCVSKGANTPTLYLDCYIVPFAHGNDPQDSGFLIDLAAEYARTWLHLPSEVQQVLFMQIYARSVVLEADKMRAEFVIYGAADNQPYTTHNGSVANHPSTSSNFAADDVIYWTITTAGVLALLGDDSVEVKVLYEDAGDGDVATNAYFRTVVIGYV